MTIKYSLKAVAIDISYSCITIAVVVDLFQKFINLIILNGLMRHPSGLRLISITSFPELSSIELPLSKIFTAFFEGAQPMSDFNSLLMLQATKRFDDPQEQKDFELQRLIAVSQATATQAIWNATKKRISYMSVGLIVLPPAFFKLITLPIDDESNIKFGVVGLMAYIVAAVGIWLLTRRLIDGDPEYELDKLMVQFLKADNEYKDRWGESTVGQINS